MKFPPLEVMIQYGIYTVKELERFSKGLVPKKKNLSILNECEKCAFVFPGPTCTIARYEVLYRHKFPCPKGPEVISNNHMCAERQLIRRLYRECLKKGYKPHQFTEWLHRKYGHMVVFRKNSNGDAISLPCVLCRKMIGGMTYVGQLMMELDVFTVKNLNSCRLRYQRLNKKER